MMYFTLSITGYAQGEVLNRGQSSATFLFNTAQVEETRSSSLGFAYNHKRRFEGVFFAVKQSGRFSSQDVTGVSAYAAFFINTSGPVNFKGFFSYSFNMPISSSLGGTIFVNNSKKDNKIVPTFSIILSEETGFSPGLDFRLGKSINLVGGINLIKYKSSDWIIGLSVGFMLVSS